MMKGIASPSQGTGWCGVARHNNAAVVRNRLTIYSGDLLWGAVTTQDRNNDRSGQAIAHLCNKDFSFALRFDARSPCIGSGDAVGIYRHRYPPPTSSRLRHRCAVVTLFCDCLKMPEFGCGYGWARNWSTPCSYTRGAGGYGVACRALHQRRRISMAPSRVVRCGGYCLLAQLRRPVLALPAESCAIRQQPTGSCRRSM
jgi:hypothetical protein